MRKTLTQRGNGWALIVPKSIIKLCGFVPQTSSLKFEFKNNVLYIQEVDADNPENDKYLIRKFSKKGTSWSLYMPNSILELLEVNPETEEVDIGVDGHTLIIRKAQP